MAISVVSSSVTLLNSDNVDAKAAVVRQSNGKDFLAAVANEDKSTSSSVTFISPSAQARFSLESFQAAAKAIQQQSLPPTVSDFKVIASGVVTSFNSLRQSLANAAASTSNLRESQKNANTLNSIDSTLANSPKAFVAALQKAGIERQNDGSFTVNQRQLTKAFNDDSKGTFATIADFASQVSKAVDPLAPTAAEEDRKAEEAAAQRAADAKRDRMADESAARPSLQDATPSSQQNSIVQPITPQPATPATDKPFQQQGATQLSGVSGFIAQSAVSTYLTVSAL